MKKGQVSIFMLIGIVIIIVILVGVTLYQMGLIFKPPERIAVKVIPRELQPLQNSINTCQERLASEAAKKILANGGYLEPRNYGIIAIIPPHGNALSADGIEIPYWHYISEGYDVSERPNLLGDERSSIASQIGNYIDERMEDCIDWEAFSEFRVTTGTPNTEVSFSDTSIFTDTYWDVQASMEDLSVKDYYVFSTETNAPVQKLYNLASYIIDKFRITRQVERLSLEWLSIYSGTGNLPPLYGGTKIGGDFRIYNLQAGKTDLQELANLQAESLQLEGSTNWLLALTESEHINNLKLAAIIPKQNNDGVSFNALHPESAGAYLAINGNQGVAMPNRFQAPSILGAFVPAIIDETYRYDYTYPLLLTIAEDDYVLNFAYEVNVRANEEQIGEVQPAASNVLCSNPGGVNARITTQPAVKTSVTYRCGEITCGIGETTDGTLEARLPACAFGTLEAASTEYFSEPVPVISDSRAGTIPITLQMYEPQTVKLTLEQRNVIPVPKEGLTAQDILENPNDIHEDFVLADSTSPINADVFMIRQGQPFLVQPDENGFAEIVPGVYDVVVLQLTEFDPPHVIPEWYIEEADETIDAMTFDSLPTAYLELSGDRGLHVQRIPQEIVIEVPSLYVSYTTSGPVLRDLDDFRRLGLLGAVFEHGQSGAVNAEYNGDKLRVSIN